MAPITGHTRGALSGGIVFCGKWVMYCGGMNKLQESVLVRQGMVLSAEKSSYVR